MYSMEFVELAGIVNLVSEKVNKMRDNVSGYEDKTYEDKVFLEVANILDDAFAKVNKQTSVYLPEYKEGYLIKQSNGRFVLDNKELSCGSYLELYIEDCWTTGRVEYSDRYYFYNALTNNPALEPGMKARTIA